MPEYLSPAVYIEEIPSGIKPIEGVSTSVGAFVGLAEKGPVGVATPINNFSEFLKTFGGFIDNGVLAFAVKAFFDEGGKSCYVVRTCHYQIPTGESTKKPIALASNKTVMTAASSSTTPSLTITALSPGTWGNNIYFEIGHRDSALFNLTIRYKQDSEKFEKLSMNSSDNNYFVNKINGISRYIVIEDKAATGAPRPAETVIPLLGGTDGLTSLSAIDFTGEPDLGNGLYAFDRVDDINIVAIPDAIGYRSAYIGGMSYCLQRGDCFFIADSQGSISTADDVINYKLAQGNMYAGENAINSKYGALYAPWIWVSDPRTGGKIKIPPSGAVAGRYAATDSTRGVHKAPAGILDGKLGTALDVEKEFSEADQEKLNPKGINVIRKIKGTGTVIWGARTVSADPEWRYVNVRRLFLFLEKSIERNTRWVVFEPNDRSLWKSIERNIKAFLKIQWLQGALVGNTEEEAFYVKCNDETNPRESRDLGRVITEIGVAPSRPAEFVVFRIQQFAGGAKVNE